MAQGVGDRIEVAVHNLHLRFHPLRIDRQVGLAVIVVDRKVATDQGPLGKGRRDAQKQREQSPRKSLHDTGSR